MRRAKRPYFGPTEEGELLELMRNARRRAILCGSAAGFGTPRYDTVHALTKAIDDLAGELTGDREYFWNKPHRTP